MGYRSDVAVVIYGTQRDPEKYELLKVLMNTSFKEVLTEFKGHEIWHDDAHVLEFKMEGVKWYDSYIDVQDFMRMLDDIGGIEGLNYEFLRVGEDDDDIAKQTGGEQVADILSVTRSIRVDL